MEVSHPLAIGRLHHTPLGRSTLYPTELVNDISNKVREDDCHSAIAMAMRKVHPFYSDLSQATRRRELQLRLHKVFHLERGRRLQGRLRPKQPLSRTRNVHPSLRSIDDYRLKYQERPSAPLDTSLVNCKDKRSK